MEFLPIYTPAGDTGESGKLLVTVWPLGSSAEEQFSPTAPSSHGNMVLANADGITTGHSVASAVRGVTDTTDFRFQPPLQKAGSASTSHPHPWAQLCPALAWSELGGASVSPSRVTPRSPGFQSPCLRRGWVLQRGPPLGIRVF